MLYNKKTFTGVCFCSADPEQDPDPVKIGPDLQNWNNSLVNTRFKEKTVQMIHKLAAVYYEAKN